MIPQFHGTDDAMTLLKAHSVTFEPTTFSLLFSATMEYVGESADGFLNEDYILGTTYWIDFQSFSESSGSVSEPGSCANRRAADYSGPFVEWWSYPVNPMDLESTPTADRMSYPPSGWTVSSMDCHTVTYERTLALTVCGSVCFCCVFGVTMRWWRWIRNWRTAPTLEGPR